MNNFYSTDITESREEENETYKRQRRMRVAKYTISTLLAVTGLVILISQFGPLALSFAQGIYLQHQAETIKTPIPEQELDPETADLPYYDPGISYFQNLVGHIGPQAVAGAQTGTSPEQEPPPVIDKTYSKAMVLTVESAGIVKVNITPNVDSFNEKTYNAALKNGLAHFKGTPLPGDGGNSFIYGHSAVDSFFSRHPDYVETIFSRLESVEIADTIHIEKDGKMLTYVVQKKKITDPNDFAVLSGESDKETVTLMTCWPLGIGSKRLIVIGERTDG
ncbi:MAG: sortase [Candidatus Dojkabacteria bacterium]|nr:sortase [Candidatus Dojkabacteria bacterium]